MNRLSSVLNPRDILRGLLLAALLSGALGAALPAPAAAAASWYVSPTGSNSNNCLSDTTPCRTITAATNRANPGDVIHLAAGQYDENVTLTKNLVLSGAGADTTIIDGGGIGPVVLVTAESGGTTVTLSGLTLQNGLNGLGGGLHSESGAGMLIMNDCRVINNVAQTGGGGIFSQGKLRLTNVVIQGNDNIGTQRGGGVLSLGDAELINVTISANTAPAGGGGISNSGIMTLTNSLVGDANEAGRGGGIYNLFAGARLTLNNTTVSGNSATSGEGGGIYNEGGLIASGGIITGNHANGSGGGLYNAAGAQLAISNGAVRSNIAQTAPGGGLYNAGVATLNSMTVAENVAATTAGGGIENSATGSLTLTGSRITDNRANNSLGGGVHNYATAHMTGVTLFNNQASSGGGLYNEPSGNLTIGLSTIISNTSLSSYGGGINNQGTLNLTQSSMVSNTAKALQGGGLYNTANAHVTNATISYNSSLYATNRGGAIYNDGGNIQVSQATIAYNLLPAVVNSSGTLAVVNSMVVSGTNDLNCSGTISSSGNNLDSGSSCGFSGGSYNHTDPLIGPLQDNGGGTLTHILYVSSPAVDAIPVCVVATDQRGVARPQGNGCDIGAYEIIGFNTVLEPPDPIAAGECITSETNVPSNLVIGSLQIGVNINYQPRGDLRVKLYSPRQTSVQLLDAASGGAGHDLDVLWDDTAPDPVGTEDHDPAFPYYDRTRRPDHPLAVMSNSALLGSWKLEICNFGTNTGTLNRWTLVVPSIGNPKVFFPLTRR